MSAPVIQSRAARLSAALGDAGSVMVGRTAVLEQWGKVAPELSGQVESLDVLLAVLRELAADGTLELPAPASWDRSTRPPLPNFVRVTAARKVVRGAPWREVAWRSELGWVASLRSVSDSQLATLVAINTWLGRSDALTPVVPARLRSAEIFGDEKLLDRLARTELFGGDRLSLALLRVTRPAPPMVVTRVGPGPDVLVIENADPFWAVVDLLSRAEADHTIGRVGWGAGRQVEKTIAALWSGGGKVGTVWYWGDLDRDGVLMAGSAAQAAVDADLGVVLPHPALWLAMSGLSPTGAGENRWDGVDDSWLGERLWDAATHVRASDGRVAQERLGLAQLAAALGLR